MSPPERSQLSLCAAVELVMSRCSISIEDARTSLAQAFYDYDLHPVGYYRAGRIAEIDWRAVRINWETSAVEWPYKASSGRSRAEDITVRRDLVEAWFRIANCASDEPDTQTSAEIDAMQGDARETEQSAN